MQLASKLSDRFDITSDTKGHLDRLLKIEILDFLCRLQDLKSLDYSTSQFNLISDEYFETSNDTNQYVIFEIIYSLIL